MSNPTVLVVVVDDTRYTFAAPDPRGGELLALAVQRCVAEGWEPWEVAVVPTNRPYDERDCGTTTHELRQALRRSQKDRRELGVV